MPFGYVFPRSGTVVIDDAIGLVRGSRHPAAARAFIDFVGSVEGQLLAAREGLPPAGPARPAAGAAAGVGGRRWSARWWCADVDWELLAREGAGLDELLGPPRPRHRAGERADEPRSSRLDGLVKRFDGDGRGGSASRSRSSGARCWRCSAPAAAARRPRSGCSPGSRRRTRGASWWTART